MGHHIRMATHRTRPDNWLIPAALAFLAATVVFATAMLIWHGGVGGDAAAVPAAAPSGTSASAQPATSAPPTPKPAAASPKPANPPATVVTIRGAQTGLCLGASDNDNGAAVVQARCNGKDRQRWRQVAAAGGTVNLVNTASGRCLDVYRGSGDDGAKVVLWSCNGGTNQQWRPTSAGNAVALVSMGSGKCLDVPGRSEKPGVKLQQLTCNGTPAQLWLLS
jgi:hypothetical protein